MAKQPDFSNKKEQRNFGLVMASAILVVGGIRWAIHHFQSPPTYFIALAAAFAFFALLLPGALKPVFKAWMKFAEGMQWVTTRVLLTVAFFVLILPGRVALLISRKDLLKRAWDPNAATYWEEPEEQPTELERYFNQF